MPPATLQLGVRERAGELSSRLIVAVRAEEECAVVNQTGSSRAELSCCALPSLELASHARRTRNWAGLGCRWSSTLSQVRAAAAAIDAISQSAAGVAVRRRAGRRLSSPSRGRILGVWCARGRGGASRRMRGSAPSLTVRFLIDRANASRPARRWNAFAPCARERQRCSIFAHSRKRYDNVRHEF